MLTFKNLQNTSIQEIVEAFLGSYYLLGVQCEAMYDNSFMARTQGQWVQIVK